MRNLLVTLTATLIMSNSFGNDLYEAMIESFFDQEGVEITLVDGTSIISNENGIYHLDGISEYPLTQDEVLDILESQDQTSVWATMPSNSLLVLSGHSFGG